MMRTAILALCLLLQYSLFCESTSNTITLQQAIDCMLNSSPKIKAADRLVLVREAETCQVGAWINPILGVEVNDIGGKCDDNTTALTIGVEQIIELGGKRQSRIEIADADRCIAYWEAEEVRRDKIESVTQAFILMAAAQERLQIAQEQLGIANTSLETVNAKVENGKASAFEQKRASIARHNAYLKYSKAKTQLEAAKRDLCVLTNYRESEFDFVSFSFLEHEEKLHPLEILRPSLCYHPLLQAASAAIMKAALVYEYEKKQRIPDVAIAAGFNQYTDPGCQTGFLGFSIPLPVWDCNQGNITKAQLIWCQLQDEYVELEKNLQRDLEQTYYAYINACEHAKHLKEEVLLMAEESYKVADIGYREGKFEYLDLLETLKNYREIKSDYVDMLLDCHLQGAKLRRLIP